MEEKIPEVVSASALEAMTRADIDMQIATAHKWPRDIQKAMKSAIVQATSSEDVADEMVYSLPRAGKEISGPSVRLAEVLVGCWQNLRLAARVMSVGEREVTAGAVAHDLETNNAISIEVSRRIVDKKGQRFPDDLVILTENAAMAIAFRNAVLKIIPRAFWQRVFDESVMCIQNGKTSIAQRRAKAIEFLMARGIPSDAILKYIDKGKVTEITGEDLVKLRGAINAAREGGIDLKEEFGIVAPTAQPKAAPAPVAKEAPKAEPVEEAAARTAKYAAPEMAPQPEEPKTEPAERPAAMAKEAAAMLPTAPSAPKAFAPKAAAPAGAAAPTPDNTKLQLWKVWTEIRNRITAKQLKIIRERAEVSLISFAIPEEKIAAIVAAAKELLEAETAGDMLPDEGATA